MGMLSGITTVDACWLPIFVRGECRNLMPVSEPDASMAPRYDEALGSVVHHVTCSFGLSTSSFTPDHTCPRRIDVHL